MTGKRKKIDGTAVDIDKEGALVVALESGKRERLLSGDVRIVR